MSTKLKDENLEKVSGGTYVDDLVSFHYINSDYTKHVGFVEEAPSKEKIEQKITKLRQQIKEAINVENFEDAAKIRDEIRILDSKIHPTREEQA